MQRNFHFIGNVYFFQCHSLRKSISVEFLITIKLSIFRKLLSDCLVGVIKRNLNQFLPALEKEMNMYINSGVSLKFQRQDEWVGVAFIVDWPRDDNYQVIDVSAKEWHNTSAQIAQEIQPDCPQIIWRDYQFQQLYNLSQKYMKKWDRSHLIWFGCWSLAESIRGIGTSDAVIRDLMPRFRSAGYKDKYLWGAQSNFRAFDWFLETHFGDDLQLIDRVGYDEEELCVDNGEKLFNKIKQLDGIHFYLGKF